MIVFPKAKINLGLNVVARRPDGFHDIESVLVPIPLCDVLEAVIDPTLRQNELIYSRSGLPIPGNVDTDLCYRAIRMVQEIRPIPGLRLHLHKVIPMGAGLGGGSSDGASTLLVVNELCDLALSKKVLFDLACQLGSDCPFFLEPTVQRAHGRGELLDRLNVDLSGLWLVLVNPGVHVGTAEVYRNTRPTGSTWDLEELLGRDRIREWSTTVLNTMEPYVLEHYSEVRELKQRILQHGAIYASMSGSGSTVFGLFRNEPEALSIPNNYRSWTFEL